MLYEVITIHYFVEQDGHTNLPVSSSASGSAPDFLIIDAKATESSFQFQDLQRDISVLIRNNFV